MPPSAGEADRECNVKREHVIDRDFVTIKDCKRPLVPSTQESGLGSTDGGGSDGKCDYDPHELP